MQTASPVRRAVFALLLLSACSYESPWTRQRNEAEALRPAEVKATHGAPAASLRTFRVRAYADPEYQAQTPRWNAHIEEQLDRASAVLEAQFGVRLVLESARPWPRQGSSARLREVLGQLQAYDPGAQVDWVIGFTASLDVFSAAQDQLGVGAFFGKHLVLRGMASAAELDAIDRALNLLPADDRATLVRQRRLHKETSILLHEWAHTLGAFHDRSTNTLMAPSYDQAMSQFSEASARIVGLGLDYRGVPAGRAAWAKAYREQVGKARDEIWDEVEKQHVLAAADEFFSTSGDLEAQDLKKLDEASAREHAGDLARARELIAPLAVRYPQSGMVQELSCAIAQEAHKDELAACRRAARLDGASAQILLMTARLTMDAGDPAETLQLLARAEPKLGSEPSAWLWLAQLDLSAGALSAAERAAARAGTKEARAVAAESRRTQAFIGFPTERVANEPEYVAAALSAHGEIEHGRLDRALAKADELAKAFPKTPAAAVVRCRVKSRGRSVKEIESACQEAAKAAPGAFLPQYILGLVHSARARWADAEASLRRAIEIDGSTREVWQSLAAVQLQRHEEEAARESREEYRQRFGSALTPTLWPRGWTARD
jgi:predicted Zn-dependent protease